MSIKVMRAQQDLQHINNNGTQSGQPPKSKEVLNPNSTITTWRYVFHFTLHSAHWNFATCKHSDLGLRGELFF